MIDFIVALVVVSFVAFISYTLGHKEGKKK